MIISLSELGEMILLSFQGVPNTLLLTAITLLFAIPLAFVMAVIRSGNKHPILQKAFGVYISFEHGVPAIVQIMLIYFTFPNLLDKLFLSLGSSFRPSLLNNFVYAALIFIILITAYLSETFRGALGALDKGQYEAAISNGLSSLQAYIHVVIPQIISISLPVLCTNVTGLIKMTSLSFIIRVIDVTAYAKVRAGSNFRYIEAYLGMSVVYIVLCFSVEALFKFLEYRKSTTEGRGVAAASNQNKGGKQKCCP